MLPKQMRYQAALLPDAAHVERIIVIANPEDWWPVGPEGIEPPT